MSEHVVIVHPGTIVLDARLLKTSAALLDAGARLTLYADQNNRDLGPLDARITLETIPSVLRLPTAEPDLNWKGKTREWLRNRYLELPLASRLAKQTAELIARERPDLVWCINWSTADIGRELSKKGVPIIYETYEYSPAVLMHPSLPYPERFKQQRTHAERRLIDAAAATVVVGNEIADLYREQSPESRFVTIYNVPPQAPLPPTEVHQPLRFYYQSIIRPHYGLEQLIEALTLIRDKDFSLDIQGTAADGKYAQNLQQLIEQAGLARKIHVLEPCELEEVVSVANRYDLGVFTLLSGTDGYVHLNNINSLPNKLFSYTAAGLGLVFSDFMEATRSLLGGTQAIAWVDAEDPERTAAVFAALIDHPDKVATMKRAAAKWAQNYTVSTERAKTIALYQEVASPLN